MNRLNQAMDVTNLSVEELAQVSGVTLDQVVEARDAHHLTITPPVDKMMAALIERGAVKALRERARIPLVDFAERVGVVYNSAWYAEKECRPGSKNSRKMLRYLLTRDWADLPGSEGVEGLLAALRAASGLTLARLGELVDLSPATLCRAEHHEINLGAGSVNNVARLYGVSAGWLSGALDAERAARHKRRAANDDVEQ